MANTRHGRQRAYMYGNTVRKEELAARLQEAPSYEPLLEQQGEVKRRKRTGISFSYALFLCAAILIMGYALVSYLTIQSDIANLVDNISGYEQTLNNLTLANDDEYSKMVNTVDYDEIRKVAIEELGMVYASEDQIVTYTREKSDYVRQLSDLSD